MVNTLIISQLVTNVNNKVKKVGWHHDSDATPKSLLGSANLFVLDRILVRLDHLLNHLTTDRTGLTRSEVAVVSLVQSNADFVSGLHLELLKSLLCLGNNDFVACHFSILLWKHIYIIERRSDFSYEPRTQTLAASSSQRLCELPSPRRSDIIMSSITENIIGIFCFLTTAADLNSSAVGYDVYVYVTAAVTVHVHLKSFSAANRALPRSGNVYLYGERHIERFVVFTVGKCDLDLSVSIGRGSFHKLRKHF